MFERFLHSADRDALARVAADGSDMARPMVIDFVVDVPNASAAEYVARAATEAGYRTEIVDDEETETLACYCSKRMVPALAAILAAQKELGTLSRPVGGRDDGWGTAGNA